MENIRYIENKGKYFYKPIGKYLENFCKEFKNNGCDWFYGISEEDLQ